MSASAVDVGDDLPLTLPALLAVRAAQHGDRTFVVVDESTLGYREAEQRSAELARGLLAIGAGKGTHVGVLMPSGPAFVVACLAAMRIGAVAVPFSTFSKADELRGLIGGADVEILLSARGHRSHDYEATLAGAISGLDLAAAGPVASTELPALRRVYVDAPSERVHPDHDLASLSDLAEDVDTAVLAEIERDVTPADAMVIIHTSGSTSAPKGVVHAHGPLIRHLDNLNELRRYTPDETLFSNSPWFWIGGFAYTLLGTLVAGAKLVCSNAAEAASVLDVIERERPTMVNGFAQSVAHLPNDPSFAGRDLSSIRRGNLYPIMPDDVRPKDPGLRHGMLGMTETGSVCLAHESEAELPEHQRGSFGRPVTGFEARVVDPDSGQPCATGEIGELWLRSPFLMEGYYGRERHEAFAPDGFFNTGDLFHCDDEGLFYFHGRSGDMIKTAGANVSPREVEAVFAEQCAVRAHVVGVDDAERGQLVAAVVVTSEPVDVEALRARLADHLSAYKVPKRFVVVTEAELPMLSSGKPDLQGLKELAGGR